jgi:hypothetical protein
MDGGRIDIRPAGSMRDDLAVVVALCVNELSKNQGVVNAPQLGIIENGVNPSWIYSAQLSGGGHL